MKGTLIFTVADTGVYDTCDCISQLFFVNTVYIFLIFPEEKNIENKTAFKFVQLNLLLS